MKRIIKCGTAFLLALVLCLCLLPTTAFAASKQVYIWNFPLSDDTLKSSGNWGHGVLNLRFGYRVGASSYTQFRCLDSWQGEVAYCIEPGAPQKNYDSITDHDDTWWDHLSLPDGHPLTPREVQRQMSRDYELRLSRHHWRRLVGRCREYSGEDGLGLCHAGPHLGGGGR